MPRIVLIHWGAAEADTHLACLHEQGHVVELYSTHDSSAHRRWRENPPDAFLIDLTRLPSHGREMAVHFRTGKATRGVPLLFVEGAPDKVEALHLTVPDAVYSSWDGIAEGIAKAIDCPPGEPARPVPMMERYAARTVAQKLGIAPASNVRTIDAPRAVERLLEPLPPGVVFSEEQESPAAVTLWFVQDAGSLYEQLPTYAPLAGRSKFWILWRKQKARQPRTEVMEQTLRDAALPLGLVDYKVCSVSDTWSALCFSYKVTAAATR